MLKRTLNWDAAVPFVLGLIWIMLLLILHRRQIFASRYDLEGYVDTHLKLVIHKTTVAYRFTSTKMAKIKKPYSS